MTEAARYLADEKFCAQANQLKKLRDLVRDKLIQEGCEQVFIDRMVLAVNEACMNVIQHAYAGEDNGEFRVEILLECDVLTFRVTDSAPVVNKRQIKARNLDDIRPGGLGVYFIHEIMDQVEFLDEASGLGNILQMKKRMDR